MPDWNTPPGELVDSHFGSIIRTIDSGETTYKITPLDYCYLAVASDFEEGLYPWLISWAIMQRFAGYFGNLWPRRAGPTGSLKRCIELYCAPLKASFAYEGSPHPRRATRGTDCSRVYRRATGIGQGSLPGAHPTGIPGAPAQTTWNLVQCSSGARPGNHGDDRHRGERNNRFRDIRRAMGLEGDPVAAWNGVGERARRAAWVICRGASGNPIPGFDNWAALDRRGVREAAARRGGTIISELPEAEREARIRSASSLPGTTNWVFGSAVGGRLRGITNRFHYRTFLTVGEIRIEFEEDGRRYNSNRSPVETGHYSNDGSSIEANSSSTSGGSVQRVTSEGLAPTQDRPAVSSSASSGGSGRSSGSAQSQVSVTRNPSEVPPEQDLFNQLEEWADNMEQELTREFGVGTRR